jgi:alpha-L-fucosidase 2
MRMAITLWLPVVSAGAEEAAAAGPERPVDWPAFLRPHDMVFAKLPQAWSEAPHFGNAMIGSMIHQHEDAIKLQIFRADVRDHRDSTWGWTAYSRPRMEIGHFLLHTAGKPTGCHWRKDLWNAELTGTLTTDKGEIRIRHFTHALDMAIVTELTPDEGEAGLRWTWHPAEARTTRPGYPADASGLDAFAKRYGAHYAHALEVPWKPNPPGILENMDGVTVWTQNLLHGGQYATAWAERMRGNTRVHIVSIDKSHPGTTAARTAARDTARFATTDWEQWIAAHRGWWHHYYPRSHVSIPDKSLEALYWHSIYRFGSTSRTGRGFVDTAGLWFQGKSWPYFTTDWNIQAAHWPVHTANRPEQGRELVDRLHRHQQTLMENVRPIEWQKDSAYLALAVAGDLRGSRDEDMRYYNLLGNLPWTLHNAWWHYRHSMDESILRETIHPLLRRAINLYLHMLVEEPDGTLRLPPTYSPETHEVADANFDLALLKWGCHILLKSSARLKIDDPLIPRWREVIRRLPDFPEDEHGFRLGHDHTSPTHHQHLSHLLMVYPLHLVNIAQPGKADVLKRSFRRALHTAGPGQRQAMVQAHAGPIGAAIGDGDGALQSLRLLQADLYPNGLWYESPCIESSLGAATIIQDMLLQSWSDPAMDVPGPIRVFPALPTAWHDAEFHDLRAEGAFLISAKRSAGKTQWVRIHSLAGEPCLVKPAIDGPIRIEGDADAEIITLSPGIHQINLGKNREVLLVPDS